jgi:tRNA(adenine34) deaminase
MKDNDIFYMEKSINLAKKAAEQGEVPVGSVVVLDNEIIGEGYNCPISMNDCSAHAEMIALRAAAKKTQNYRLINTILYVTLEPCMMCIGAMIHARIGRLVFGAYDPKSGAVESQIKILEFPWLNHRIKYMGGILGDKYGKILKRFFRERR